ncbi:MAG: FGGY-family carbohydrate kinase [Spirochaetaceae bacterium]|jgi:sugar (pentulose or hexulose) kinase|nr:FGGY-family carbohydrate kinase [Spirochaetaceae bacterium]
MAEPLVLTFDMGTQSARAVLVNPQGDILFKVQKIYEPPYVSRAPGWAEQRAEFYWESILELSRRLKAESGDAWGAVTAVTCTTIRDTCVCLDRDLKPLREIILWIDDRPLDNLPPLPAAVQAALKLAMVSDKLDLQRRKSHCNWIALNQRDLWERTCKYVMFSTWLNYKFTGNLADSDAGVIGHVPYDNKLRSWMKKNDFRRMVFDLSDDKLFDIVPPGTVIGPVTPAAAEETGIPAGVPFVATGSDKGCETLGLSCLAEHKAALSFGTTATVQLSTRRWFEPTPFMPSYAAIVPGYYNPEIQINRGYWLLSWFKREFAAKEVVQAGERGVSAERLLDERLKEIPPGCDGLILQPYFTPAFSMPHAKGVVIGFSDVHTRIHLYRAIIEGLNFALLEGLRTMEKRGGLKVTEIYAAGGGSQSAEVCRITASQFGLPVYRTQTYEAGGIGASLCAFVSRGVFSSYEEGLARMVHVRDEFLPDEGEHEIYGELYERIFTKLFTRLSPLYQEINQILRKK